MSGAVGQRRVPTPYLAQHPIAVPSGHEQRRIVAKVQELFSELDKGIENLKTAHAQLGVYRLAVLKHAFEGRLTARWREDNEDQLESLEELLTGLAPVSWTGTDLGFKHSAAATVSSRS